MEKAGLTVWVCIVGAMVLFLALFGCTQSPESSPLIRKMLSEFTTLQEDFTDLKDQVRRLESDIGAMNQEIQTIKQQPAARSVDTKEIARLTEQLNDLTAKISRMEKDISNLGSTVRSGTSTVTPSTATTAPPPEDEASEETYARPSGTYYTIQKDDTLEKIAEKHNVTVEQIRSKNRLPEKAKIFAGQKLFIPSSK